ncbi:ABC transporter permease [Streptomyces sp. bgisy091]|uniref:ABC transporter permease n=1 Tax=Streptomyces sp. bgisy091 TaxID=3413778 RepID=UPI003D713492
MTATAPPAPHTAPSSPSRRARQLLSCARQGAVVALADFRVFYTWRTWLGGWLVRLLCQTVFYALLAGMTDDTGDSGYVGYVVVGAAVMIGTTEALLTTASTTWDTHTGTMPLLVASPAPPGFYYLGRSVQWPLSGVVTCSVALLGLSPLFGVAWEPWQLPAAVALVALCTFGTYSLALAVGVLALLAPSARNVLGTLVVMAVTAFCGAMIPVSHWPFAVRAVIWCVPTTHGLEAVRQLLDGSPGALWREIGLTLAATTGWTAIALTGFHLVFSRARRGGSLLV